MKVRLSLRSGVACATSIAAVVLAGCANDPPMCSVDTLECQFEHYKYDTSRMPPRQWRADEIAKFEGARPYVEEHSGELEDFAYQTLLQSLAENQMKMPSAN